MEISPIAGIRVMPVKKVRPVYPELTATFDIESLVRPTDDCYSNGNQKAAGAEDPEEDSEDLDDLTNEAGLATKSDRANSLLSIFA
jgi:hypothetical protein